MAIPKSGYDTQLATPCVVPQAAASGTMPSEQQGSVSVSFALKKWVSEHLEQVLTVPY